MAWRFSIPSLCHGLSGPFWRENKDCEEMRPKVGKMMEIMKDQLMFFSTVSKRTNMYFCICRVWVKISRTKFRGKLGLILKAQNLTPVAIQNTWSMESPRSDIRELLTWRLLKHGGCITLSQSKFPCCKNKTSRNDCVALATCSSRGCS